MTRISRYKQRDGACFAPVCGGSGEPYLACILYSAGVFSDACFAAVLTHSLLTPLFHYPWRCPFLSQQARYPSRQRHFSRPEARQQSLRESRDSRRAEGYQPEL